MPASTLTRYKTQANKIMKDIRLLRNKDIASLLGISPQLVNYKVNNSYPKDLPDIIRVLNLAGYEIKRIEGEEDEG